MRFLARLKVGQRLTLAFSMLVALILVMAAVGYTGARTTYHEAEIIYRDGAMPLAEIGEVNYYVQRSRVAAMDMLLRPEPDVIADRKGDIARSATRIDELWALFSAHSMSENLRSLSDEFAGARSRFVDEGLNPLVAAIESGNITAARDIYDNRVSVLAPELQAVVSRLVQSQIQYTEEHFDVARSVSESVTLWLIAICAAAALVASWLGWQTARSITRPIDQALMLAEAVAGGDLTRQVRVSGRDEVANLLHALNRMSASLAQVVSQVRVGSESVAMGSTQIAAGTIDLSQRTEQQAANLEETASAMEEISTTVRNNADTSREARELAEATRERATEGGRLVADMVQTMQAISGSSKKIAEIISVIDGIAFQTNILALNAAVEAARAGEQGRGFAVVAGEVRTLAQRSALAAREIKGLIEDSTLTVSNGEALVQRTGTQVTEIIDQVRNMADLINDISSASAEQATGIGEVELAVGQLDQVTQQNAALVEESSAAAESLKEQAIHLRELVSTFRVDNSAPQAEAWSPDHADTAADTNGSRRSLMPGLTASHALPLPA